MNTLKRSQKALWGILILLMLVGCNSYKDVPEVQPIDTSTPTPLTPTDTSGPPTPTLVEEPILFGEVTFDGNECTVEGPSEVPRGAYYFILNDESDKKLKVFLNQILEGKMFENLVDWQEEPGVYLSPPDWIHHPGTTYSFKTETTVHFLDQVGNYAIVVGDDLMKYLWFCEPFRVVAVGSE
jgi:hypothetical protein